ncbi:beta-propeller domain-containing protein [Paenibacillus sp. PL2-23]|uniref:beta-propeller domain-containing protein n=1 Tax=Paenibacillus sp. PL2-23 TaxID=2100729 RepID=UPI0030F9FD1D
MNKKAMLAACLTLTLCVAATLQWAKPADTASAQEGIKVVIEGKPLTLSTPAFIENGSTLVPVREIAEALGAEVTYKETDKGARTVRLTRGAREALLTIGSTTMEAGGKRVTLNAYPRTVKSITMVPLRAISESLGTVVTWDGIQRIVSIDEPLQLPSIGSEKKLAELLQHMAEQRTSMTLFGAEDGAISAPTSSAVDKAAAAPEAAPAASDDGGAGSDYSRTNVQVDGVDEADWVKTDGNYIYQISGSRVVIADIADPAKPRLTAELSYSREEGFQPQQLYIDDSKLLVIGSKTLYDNASHSGGTAEPASPSEGSATRSGSGDSSASSPVDDAAVSGKMAIMPIYSHKSMVVAYVYELGSDGKPTLTRQLEQEGSYLSSRKIGNALYLITNKYTYHYGIYDMPATKSEQAAGKLAAAYEPSFRDTAVSDELQTVKLSDIRYFPEPVDNSMMLVGAVDLGQPEGALQVSAYFGAGGTIYASQRNLYTAQTVYAEEDGSYKGTTKLHKFRLDNGSITYISEGSVPGALLNQFSMDEHEGYFRVALTKGDMWAAGEAGSTNNVYVLNEKLETVGKLEGLAPGERIYSVRFMGDRAYMVTFRNVDPLFVIDLANPAKPGVLGQLKIPGYSDYLHPYDENHLIGFGKETIELPSGGMSQDDTIAYTQGMKLALFDVTDVTQPKELFKEIIGDRGTHSELLYDHKALLFSKDKGLLAFPVELYEVSSKAREEAGSSPAYGQFTYQGAYVYGIDLKKGFQLRGRISHLSESELAQAGHYGYDYTKTVRRILYAGDTLYTLSEAMLKANRMDNLQEQGSLPYPHDPGYGYGHGKVGVPMPIDPMPAVEP